jgi:hypothetical protein
MKAIERTARNLEQALTRSKTARRGDILRSRFRLELARTEHLKQELKLERTSK